jgi:hypothetical protein
MQQFVVFALRYAAWFVRQSAFALPLLAVAAAPVAAQGVFQSSDLPIIFVETGGQDIPDEPKITATMRVIFNGPGQVNQLSDPPNHFNGYIGIERRGSTSSDLSDKKPYGVEIRDADGEDLDFPLLGMPAESDWVFIAPFSDKSLLRDAFALELARRIMPGWTPRTRFVELMLNGQYQGIYLVTEKIKRGAQRLDISRLRPEDVEGDELTGGYLLKLDKSTGGAASGWASAYLNPSNQTPTFYQFEYPKMEDLQPAQYAYMKNWVEQFEAAMRVDDPLVDLDQYIDLQSFVRYCLVNEITKNVDGYRLSTFLHKDKDSESPVLRAGPVWDYNIALGNADYCGGDSIGGWAMDFNQRCPADYWVIDTWWLRLWAHPQFRQALRSEWQALRQSSCSDAALLGLLDSLNTVVADASGRNFERWPNLYTWTWPNVFCCGDYPAHVGYLHDWLEARLAWLDAAMPTFYLGTYAPADHFAPQAYPNPSDGLLHFKFYARHNARFKIRIYAAKGDIVELIRGRAALNGEQLHTERLDHLPAGLYFYEFLIEEKTVGRGKFLLH